MRLDSYCPNITMETILMNTENSNTNKPHKSVLNLQQRLDLESLNKHVALQGLSICYTWKTSLLQKQQTQNKSCNMERWAWITRWFVSRVRNSILYHLCHTKHETIILNPPIHIYINSINKRLVFKIKRRIYARITNTWNHKIFCNTKKLIYKTKNVEN